MNTLLYSSDRTHLTSSTTTTQPGSSVCSYFGCYGCLGFQYYTFSEVSCTSQSSELLVNVYALIELSYCPILHILYTLTSHFSSHFIEQE